MAHRSRPTYFALLILGTFRCAWVIAVLCECLVGFSFSCLVFCSQWLLWVTHWSSASRQCNSCEVRLMCSQKDDLIPIIWRTPEASCLCSSLRPASSPLPRYQCLSVVSERRLLLCWWRTVPYQIFMHGQMIKGRCCRIWSTDPPIALKRVIVIDLPNRRW